VLAPTITQGYVSDIMRRQQTNRRVLLREFEEGLVRFARDAAEQTQQSVLDTTEGRAIFRKGKPQ
jgi:hypothetical protein